MNIDYVTIFFYSGIIGTVVFILKTLLPIDSSPEIDSNFMEISDSDSSFTLFTIESISAFFMCGGWMGYISNLMHYRLRISIIIAIVSGLIGMLFFVWLISKLKKLEHIPTPDLNELTGKIGKAYMRFAPKGQAKIEIEYNSKLETLDATNISDIEINSFEQIKVVKVENNVIYIEKA